MDDTTRSYQVGYFVGSLSSSSINRADSGEVSDETTAAFLSDFMQEFKIHTERVLTVIPRS